LDHTEAQLGSPLPPSYRAFLKRFGPGELECTFRLTPVAVTSRPGFTIVEETVEQRAFFSHRGEVNADRLSRFVYFGCNAGGEWYVWDPKELAKSGTQECPVYCLRRHEEDDPELVADSFFECVRVVMERVKEWREEEPEEREEGMPENAFSPYYLRTKKAPDEGDVAKWLAWNNNTARDLALSIRDHGRTDGFPILADALQEAGCTNADLLDSCRTGDPDIDGVWVLRVLLGEL
jgi:hypothetical protein